ncbi:MAG: PQQ-binding-like beta-propeller repeat protein [Pseudomonadota bacterium]
MTRLQLLISAALAASLSACSILSNQSEARKAEEAADRAGRITMVLGEPELEADPGLAGVEIALPDEETIDAWPQAGLRSSKVVGNIDAAADFQIAWRADAGRGSDNKSALTTPPVTSDTAIFTLDAQQTLSAFDINSGRRIWRKELDSGSRRDRIGFGGGLAVDGDQLIVASGYGFVAAFDTGTGSQIWRRDMDSPMTGAPTIMGERFFVASNNNELFAMTTGTGEILWSDIAISEPARVLGSNSPAAVEEIVVAPYSSGEVIAYLAANGQRLWEDALARPGRFTPISAINDIAARPILAGGLVFVVNQSGMSLAIDGRSGTRVWASPVGSTQAPVLAGEALFVMSVDGKLVALQASSGAVYWSKQLRRWRDEEDQKGRISYAGPLLASGRLVVANSRGDLKAFDPQTGEETASLKLGGPVYLEPIAAQGKLFVLTDEGKLIAIR